MQSLEATVHLQLLIRCQLTDNVIHFQVEKPKKNFRLDFDSLNEESKSLFVNAGEFYKEIKQCLKDDSILILGSSLFIKIEYNLKSRKVEEWKRFQLVQDFAQNVQKVREDAGLKQQKVGGMCGIQIPEEVKENRKFVIDDKNRELKHFSIKESIIEKLPGLYFSTVYGKYTIVQHTSLSFKVVSLKSKVMFGICTEEAKMQGSIETSQLHIGYRSDGDIWSRGETSKAVPQFNEGDTITLLIDPISKEISWLNGWALVTTEKFPDWGEAQLIYPYVCMQSSDIVQIET